MKIRNSSLLKIKKLKGKKRFVTRNALCANLKRRPQQTRITDFFGNKPAPTIRKIEIYDGKIKCFQINNQKRIESCERIANYCDNSESFIVLGQEPSTFGCGITGLNNRHNKTYAVMERPRAYIYTHKNLTTWPLDHLCSRDVASLLLDSNKESYGKLLLCSIYWDGRIDTFPQEALEAMKLANLKGYTILLGGDMNARNTIYGSRLTDTRGKVLEDILIRNNLHTLNIGIAPTCMASNPGSVIDMTAITSGMESLISDWKVSKMHSESDHRIIEFTLSVPKIEKKKRTVMSKTNKTNFTTSVEEKAAKMLTGFDKEYTDVKSLEANTNAFIKCVKDAHLANSRSYEIKIKPKNNIIRDKRVKDQIKLRDIAQRAHRRRPNQQTRKALDRENAKLKSVNRKVRTEEFRGEMNKIVTNEDMAKLAKFAKQGKIKEITLIKNNQGDMATSPEEAVENLCSAHFPTAIPLDDDKREAKIEKANSERGQVTITTPDYLEPHILKKAIKTFNSHKSPGLDGITPELMKLFGDNCLKLLSHLFSCQLSLQYTAS